MRLSVAKFLAYAPSAGLALLSGGGDTASSLDVVSLMGDSVTSVQGQIFGVLSKVVPAIVLVVGAVVCVKFGISWIKKIRG